MGRMYDALVTSPRTYVTTTCILVMMSISKCEAMVSEKYPYSILLIIIKSPIGNYVCAYFSCWARENSFNFEKFLLYPCSL